MLGGQGPKNRDRYLLLLLLEELFDAEHGYPTGNAPPPKQVVRLAGEVQLLRLRRVCAAFGREFGLELTPAALSKIESVLAGDEGVKLAAR